MKIGHIAKFVSQSAIALSIFCVSASSLSNVALTYDATSGKVTGGTGLIVFGTEYNFTLVEDSPSNIWSSGTYDVPNSVTALAAANAIKDSLIASGPNGLPDQTFFGCEQFDPGLPPPTSCALDIAYDNGSGSGTNVAVASVSVKSDPANTTASLGSRELASSSIDYPWVYVKLDVVNNPTPVDCSTLPKGQPSNVMTNPAEITGRSMPDSSVSFAMGSTLIRESFELSSAFGLFINDKYTFDFVLDESTVDTHASTTHGEFPNAVVRFEISETAIPGGGTSWLDDCTYASEPTSLSLSDSFGILEGGLTITDEQIQLPGLFGRNGYFYEFERMDILFFLAGATLVDTGVGQSITQMTQGGLNATLQTDRIQLFFRSPELAALGQASIAAVLIIPSTAVALDLDADDDFLTDFNETEIYGTDPSNPDTDSDGVSDYDEVLAGTSPLPEPIIIPMMPPLLFVILTGLLIRIKSRSLAIKH